MIDVWVGDINNEVKNPHVTQTAYDPVFDSESKGLNHTRLYFARVDSDLLRWASADSPAEAGRFSVEAGSNWAFGVDVRTPLWI